VGVEEKVVEGSLEVELQEEKGQTPTTITAIVLVVTTERPCSETVVATVTQIYNLFSVVMPVAARAAR